MFIRYDDVHEPVLLAMNLRDHDTECDLSILNEKLELAEALGAAGSLPTLNGSKVHLPAYSIALILGE